jgi:pyrimidine-nucleoside phosphorylase
VRPYELIKAKRDGQVLSAEAIQAFISSYTRGEIPDYQVSALLMAIFFRGMSSQETAAWTDAMLRSGEVLDLSDVPGVKVDKHSTGGVGDKVSLSLAPLVAACGVPVPMVAGRGLGHTGGTIDKLEAIPGFRVDLSTQDYRRLVKEVGCCIIGQTATLAPADRKLYALRDVTATIECIPLIASSIMSKKMAEGIDALVLDVKVGNGAFMKKQEDARQLARTMMEIGARLGRRVVTLLTDMEQPLGRAVGNALEVHEATELLKARAPEDLTECTLALGAEMLVAGKVAADLDEARLQLEAAIRSGAALSKWRALIAAQGGDARIVDEPQLLPQARGLSTVNAAQAGFVTSIDTEGVGLAAMALGAGRERKEDLIDMAVGFTLLKKEGDRVEAGEPMVRVHYNDEGRLAAVKARLMEAYRLGDSPRSKRPLILERLS